MIHWAFLIPAFVIGFATSFLMLFFIFKIALSSFPSIDKEK